MKVLALVILVVASASARGSGPYLPSGWRPSGPAFFLPTEVQKPAVIPLKDVPVQVEEESLGTDALREYGPPRVQVSQAAVQEVSQDLTQQALPDPITEQAFVVIEAKFNEAEDSTAALEAVTEKVEEVTSSETESEDQNTEALVQGRSLEVESQTESSLAVEEETNAEVTEQVAEVTQKSVEVEQTEQAAEIKEEDASSNIVASAEQRIEEEVTGAVEEGAKNIAEALVNLENEINAEKIQEISEVKSVQEISGAVERGPAGFLEYGPPGFTEYGPPKGEPRTEEQAALTFENNETRRRRFSPKFKAPKRKH